MGGHDRPHWTGYVAFFALVSVVYHSNLRPIASGDSLPASLIPFSIILDGSSTLDRFGPYINSQAPYAPEIIYKSGRHWYSRYPIAGPVLVAPLYLPFAPWLRHSSPGFLLAIARIAEKAIAVALAAGAAVALLCLLQRLTSERAAWVLTLTFALGTNHWSTASQALWQHTFGQLFIVAWLYSIERLAASRLQSLLLAAVGIFGGCAIAIRPTNIALLPASAAALYCLRAPAAAHVRAFAPLLAVTALAAGYNVTAFGRITGGYAAEFGRHPLAALAGILVSPGRGLLVYTPAALFALLAFAPIARDSLARHRPIAFAAGIFSLFQLASIAIWPVWWGGYCWGPRLLTEILAPLMVLIAIGLPAMNRKPLRLAFAAAVLYGFLIQALGVYFLSQRPMGPPPGQRGPRALAVVELGRQPHCSNRTWGDRLGTLFHSGRGDAGWIASSLRKA
jgi:hypothetical protein